MHFLTLIGFALVLYGLFQLWANWLNGPHSQRQLERLDAWLQQFTEG